jgi:hypothetical protein
LNLANSSIIYASCGELNFLNNNLNSESRLTLISVMPCHFDCLERFGGECSPVDYSAI